MLITKTAPVGIDFKIQQLQTLLHSRLMALWNLDPLVSAKNVLYQCYGRCYRNRKDPAGYIAEVYNGSNEYKEVYWDDTLYAISFFGIGSQEKHDIIEKANVHLIFFVNLEKLKPNVTHRADEEVRKDVQLLVNNFGFTQSSTELWVENVLKEYPGSHREERLKAVDMQPIHCFRINLEVNYKKNIC